MPSYRIEGGTPLRGAIRASGAKNAVTKQIVAALLTDDEVVLDNVPRIGDVTITVDMVKAIGAEVEVQGETIRVRAATVKSGEVPVAFSGVNRIHHGPCDVDWRPSRTPEWHQSAIVETVTFSKPAETLAEQRPSAR